MYRHGVVNGARTYEFWDNNCGSNYARRAPIDAVTETIATDLHGHTRFSDGRAEPEDYVAFRAELGMQVIAVSDHDSFAGGAARGRGRARSSASRWCRRWR